MVLEFRNLTLENLAQYELEILESELVFHEDLREDSESVRETMACRGYMGKLAILDGKYIGNAQGFSPMQADIDEMELKGVNEDSGMIYIGNFVIDSGYKGNGFGTQLLLEFTRESKLRGFRRAEGHFRNGTSLHVARKLGAEEVEVFEDWYGTGEPYTHCRIDLT